MSVRTDPRRVSPNRDPPTRRSHPPAAPGLLEVGPPEVRGGPPDAGGKTGRGTAVSGARPGTRPSSGGGTRLARRPTTDRQYIGTVRRYSGLAPACCRSFHSRPEAFLPQEDRHRDPTPAVAATPCLKPARRTYGHGTRAGRADSSPGGNTGRVPGPNHAGAGLPLDDHTLQTPPDIPRQTGALPLPVSRRRGAGGPDPRTVGG